MFDLVIRNGTVVNADGSQRADVGIAGDTIAGVGPGLEGARYIEAAGRLVIPGGVDPHVHLTPLMDPPPGWPERPDDFERGTRAALAGGITTVANMTHQVPGGTLAAALARDEAVADDLAVADYVLHPVVNEATPAVLEEVRDLASLGCQTVKVFLTAPDPGLARLASVMEAASQGGVTVLAHCEDGDSVRRATASVVASGVTGAAAYPEAHPVSSEVEAVRSAIEAARDAGCRLYIVHLAASEALALCVAAGRAGLDVLVETRPLYLHLTEEVFERPDGALFVGNPPIRSEADRAALWEGVASGDVTVVGSDHAPWTREQKLDSSRDVSNLLPGVADLETLRPMLFSEGVLRRRLPVERFVAVTASEPARALGIHHRKGTIRPGADADVVVWDPSETRIVDGSRFVSGAGHSVYDGWQVTGWPEVTVAGGLVVPRGAEGVVPAGRGRRVRAAG